MISASSDMAGSDMRVLQAIYDQLQERCAWPTFAQIDRVLDRGLGIEDAQAALAGLPAEYLVRSWHRAIYSDVDEIRLTLRGVAACDGAEPDLQLLVTFLRWAADRERAYEGDDRATVTSLEFARDAKLSIETPADETSTEATSTEATADAASLDAPAASEPPSKVSEARSSLARVGVLAMSIPTFWTSAGHQEDRWYWTFTLDRGIRQFRDLADVAQLLEVDDRFRRAISRTAFEYPTVDAPEGVPEVETGNIDARVQSGDSLDVLMTVLRPEIVDAAGAQLRGGLFDDAVFAAYRRIEHEIQQRTALTGIGDTLVKEAFSGQNRISISSRPQDANRMIEIFGGVLGLHKGDRSHKDKPALPCRSRHECLRLLGQASALLDLLDRGIEHAPKVDGYQQHDNSLELSLQRVGPTARVWLGERPCLVRARTSVTLTIDIAGVPAGLHDLYVVDGTRQGPAVPVFVVREPGRANWYRVTEVGIELFRDELGNRFTDVFGVRLEALESGVRSERVVTTTDQYEVGDYVDWEWATRPVGPVWLRPPGSTELLQLCTDTPLFTGRVIGPGQTARTLRYSLEPPMLKLRRGDKAPVRVLRHVSDGVATWTEAVDSLDPMPDDGDVAHVKGGTVFAKQDGTTEVRLHHDGQYCAASIEVAAHPSGAVADVMTGLPPVAGIASIGERVAVSCRSNTLWSIRDGKFIPLARVPREPAASDGGTDKIAAAPNGDLAIRTVGRPDILVLQASYEYTRSRLIELPDGRQITCMTWTESSLIAGTNTGEIWQIAADGRSQRLTTVAEFVVALAADSESVYVLSGSGPRSLLRFALAAPDKIQHIWEPGVVGDANSLMCLDKELYLTTFHKGQVARASESGVHVVADGLSNPCALAAGANGTIYVAEFGRGAVRRIFA